MNSPTPEHLMLENTKTGEATFRALATELKDAGYQVNEEHAIDPVTGQIAYVSVTSGDSPVQLEKALAVFKKLYAMNVMIGIGTSLRMNLWHGVSSGAIKLHDYGFRRTR